MAMAMGDTSTPNNPILNPLKRREWLRVEISKVDNGFIVSIGCATFVETSWDKICKALKEYWDNPEEAEKKYCKKIAGANG